MNGEEEEVASRLFFFKTLSVKERRKYLEESMGERKALLCYLGEG